jgi:hypothetical protein
MVRKESAPKNLSIADEFMGTSLIGLDFEKGGLDDLKLDFEAGDGVDSWLSPRKTLESPLPVSSEVEGDEDMFSKIFVRHLEDQD